MVFEVISEAAMHSLADEANVTAVVFADLEVWIV